MNDNSKLYKIRYRDISLERKNLAWKIVCEKIYQKYINSNDTVLDVASGHGEFINNIHSKCKMALDLNPDAALFLDKNIVFHNINAFEIKNKFKNLDVILVSNFLEHLADKKELDNFLHLAFEALNPGGRMLIVGPNLRYLPGKYWDYYDHNIGLTHFSLMEALELNGFKILKCIDRFLPHLDRGSKMKSPLFFIKLYLIFPFMWRFMGADFFIVANKP